MKVLHTLLLLTSFGGIASAATIVQTQNFGFVPNGTATQTFNQFNASLGTLTSITVTVLINKTGGHFEVDNDSATSGTISLVHSIQGALTSEDVGLVKNNLTSIFSAGALDATSTLSSQFVAATTGDSTSTFNSTGLADNVVYNPADLTVSATGTIGSAAYSGYIGTGTYSTVFGATQIASATGLGGLQQAFTVSDVSGYVQVTYNYTPVAPVPEPASTMLGGLGLIVLVSRHRRR